MWKHDVGGCGLPWNVCLHTAPGLCVRVSVCLSERRLALVHHPRPEGECYETQALESNGLGSNVDSPTGWLCDLRQVA